ncbi:fungal-specific transcription factor domain-containing protein [Astrocystis sublimbata]|nr:fungal-specific transcription factor domain-containing protein [Astrocystis sublimbata]
MSSNDPGARRILPQSAHVNSFSFVPPSYQPPRETQKNYVFVDEHNRHKRLKVMRACEGCRRRKIKCDAATTNTWPCSACIRLKLHCVRPNAQYEESPDETQSYEPSRADFEAGQESFRQMAMQQPSPQQMMMAGGHPKPSMYANPSDPYSNHQAAYSLPQYGNTGGVTQQMPYGSMPQVGVLDQSYAPAHVFPTPPLPEMSHPQSGSSPESYTDYGHNDLADLLGPLKLDERGTAPYLNNKQALASHEEEPAIEEVDDFKAALPPVHVGPGSKIRIPPELMPDADAILHYFELYFTHVHPYVPVLNKSQLYHQWMTNRESISPLLLEAIFAVAERLADEPAQGQQWIALASKHADAFMDVPRLSTLQALLIILKAREAVPKRGYYYRSWMSIVHCVAMARDLGLDEHFQNHQAGKPCGSTPTECLTKTRVWQTIFICETMIAAPQGRNDLAVELDTLDFSVPQPMPGVEADENQTSRDFIFFTRIVRMIAKMTTVYGKIKKKKDWGLEPEFVQLNPQLRAWLSELPPHMTITFPQDGSSPWVPSHFIGNIHSYYHLATILLHRPQLTFLEPMGIDGQWKTHMMISYASAKALCRLQESMLQSFGLSGLQCMQRGISFTIYAVLSCIVLHLVAITSPDPEFNTDAREYFTRHMRILEKTMGSWPLPEMLKQIDAVREAFSADTRKSFVLKPSFPYGSPHPTTQSSPPRASTFKPPMLRTNSLDPNMDVHGPHSHVSYHPITPVSLSSLDGKGDSSQSGQQSLSMLQSTQPPTMPQTMSLVDQPTWNPSRIFDQWNSTFGTPMTPTQPPPTSASMSSSLSLNISSSPTGAPEVPTSQDIALASTPISAHPHHTPPQLPSHQQQYSAAPPPRVQNFVTPAMWQESVASVYESGALKRHWDFDGGVGGASIAETMNKRR